MSRKPISKKPTAKKTTKKAAIKKTAVKKAVSKLPVQKNLKPIKKAPSKKGAQKKSAGPQAAVTALMKAAVQSLEDSKAESIVTIDLFGKSSIADYLIIASGRSSRQVASTAERLIQDLAPRVKGPIRAEGQRGGDWVLVDVGDVIVHLFRPEVREFYNLEKMWSADLPEDDS